MRLGVGYVQGVLVCQGVSPKLHPINLRFNTTLIVSPDEKNKSNHTSDQRTAFSLASIHQCRI